MAEWDWRLPPPQLDARITTENEPVGGVPPSATITTSPPPPLVTASSVRREVAPAARGRGRGWSIAAAIALAVGLGALTVSAFDPDSPETSSTVPVTTVAPVTTASVVTTPSTAPTTTPAPTTTAAPATTTTVPAPTSTSTTAAPATTTAAPATTVSTSDPSPAPRPGADGVTRWAVYQSGKVYLRGVVPDDATAAEIAKRATAVVGPGNVVDEYSRVPGAPVPRSAPIYVADVVLFNSDSSVVRPAFLPIVQLGVKLMTLFPKVIVTVRGHTDDLGSPEHNARLAAARAEALIVEFEKRGIDRARLIADPIASDEPAGDNETVEGRQLNRRAEFVITGLLES